MHGTDLLHFPWMLMEMQMHDLHFHADALQNALFHAPQRNVHCPGEGGASMSAVAASLRGSEAKPGKFHQAATFFHAPGHSLSCPAPTANPQGTYPSPTTTHLMACMALDPWRRTEPEAKGSQAKANSREGWANVGIRTAGCKEEGSGRGNFTRRSLRPSTAAAALWPRALVKAEQA